MILHVAGAEWIVYLELRVQKSGRVSGVGFDLLLPLDGDADRDDATRCGRPHHPLAMLFRVTASRRRAPTSVRNATVSVSSLFFFTLKPIVE